MKKFIITIFLTLALCGSCVTPTLAAYYTFGSGPDSSTIFKKPTGYDEPVQSNPLTANERRDKNAAYFPPSYGIFSGEIPTDQMSLFHNNSPANAQSAGIGTTLVSTAITASIGGTPISVSLPDTPGLLPSTSTVYGAAVNTEPRYYDDGSIGILFIKKLNKSIKVFQGESLENMKKGIGHFESTSVWDGNVGLAGHNRGAAAYFGFVKNLEIGDEIIYTTPYGTRTYAVYSKEKISETDFSSLEWTANNRLTLITCVEDSPVLRWRIFCCEVR